MAMSDEAMFAPPQGITIEAVNGMLAERLAQKHGKASLLRAFIPLPPPFSPVQLIELHVLKSNFYYRCDGNSRVSGRDGRLFASRRPSRQ